MKKIDTLFKDNETLKSERSKIEQELLNNILLKRYLMQEAIDPNIVKKYPMRFLRLVEQLEICERCSGLDHCLLANKGHYQALVNDDMLKSVYRPCRYQLQYEKDNAHLKKYLINDLPDEMRSITLGSIELTQENNKLYLEAVKKIWDWLDHQTSKGLYLHGPVGTGKTYLLACVANNFARRGQSVAFVHTPKLLVRLKAAFGDDDEQDDIMSALIEAELLILDDIGAEPVTGWYRDEILATVLNERMTKQKLTCFSSNLDLKELGINFKYNQKGEVDELKAQRIMERIRMLADPIMVPGNNRRFKLISLPKSEDK